MSLTGYASDFALAGSNLWAQKTRTVLTALGIIFGVGAVIGMLAIGAGAREESLKFIETLGVRNLLIESRPATSDQELQQRRRSSPGLTERDVRVLEGNVDALEQISARRGMHPAQVFPKPGEDLPELYGVRPAYAAIHNWKFTEGVPFDKNSDDASAAVCVLGERAKVAVLGYGPAVDKFVKVNDTWLRVVGVLKDQVSSGSGTAQSQDPNFVVYIPLNTFQYRFFDRGGSFKDELDGVDIRLKEGGNGDSGFHPPQDRRFRGDHSGGITRRAAAFAIDLYLRNGRDCGDFAAGGRHRHHEYRARDGARTNARDWYPAIHRRAPRRHRAAISFRIDSHFNRGWGGGDSVWIFPFVADRARRGVEHDCYAVVDRHRIWSFGRGRRNFWHLSGEESVADRSDRSASL